MLKTKITFYDLEKFGFYLNGSNNRAFADPNSLLTQLKEWATIQEDLISTSPRDSDLSEEESGNLYYLDSYKDGKSNEWVLILWDSSVNGDGKLLGVSVDQKVGDNSYKEVANSQDIIPGQPIYFWFLPETDTLATIHFSHSKLNIRGMKRYLSNFFHYASNYVISDGSDFKGYSDGITPVRKRKFEILTNKKVRHAKRKELQDRVAQITHILEKVKIIRTNASDSSDTANSLIDFKWILVSIVTELTKRILPNRNSDGKPDAASNAFSQRIDNSSEIDLTLSQDISMSPELLEEIINEHDEHPDGLHKDIGFKIGREQFWLNNTDATSKLHLNVDITSEKLPSAEDVWEALDVNRKNIFTYIDSDDEHDD